MPKKKTVVSRWWHSQYGNLLEIVKLLKTRLRFLGGSAFTGHKVRQGGLRGPFEPHKILLICASFKAGGDDES